MKHGEMKRSPLWASVAAEFVKLWNFRMQFWALLGVPVFTFLVALQLFHYEHLAEHISSVNAFAVVPYLFFGSWGSLVIVPLYLMVFSVYAFAAESQTGMVRVCCTQPVSRVRYALTKLTALCLHGALVIAVYCLTLVLWGAVFGTLRGTIPEQVYGWIDLSGKTILWSMAWCAICAGAALYRKTLLSSIMMAFIIFVGLVWMNVLPTSLNLRPMLFVRYYFYGFQAVRPDTWKIELPNLGEPLWLFLATCIVTPAVIFAPALTLFARRDITE